MHLVGHCIGGWIAAEMAIRSTQRLASLTLLAPAGVAEPRRRRSTTSSPGAPEEFARRQFHDQKLAEAWQAGAGQARHRHHPAEPHRSGAARLEPAPAQSATAALAAPHRRSDPAGLGRERSRDALRLPPAVRERDQASQAHLAAATPVTRCRSRAQATSPRGSRPSCKEPRDENVLLPPHALRRLGPHLHGPLQFRLGDAAEFLFRSEGRREALPALHRRTGIGRPARLRRHLRQRAPPDRLRADAGAEPDRRRARALDQAGQDRDPRPRAAAGEQSGGAGGRVRHARPDERRPHHHRLRARHRHRILRQRRQSDLLARALLRGARADPAGVDRDRAVPLPRQALPVRLRQSVAAAAAAAASAGLDSIAGQFRNRRVVRVGEAQVHLPADLQPDQIGPEGVRPLPAGGRTRRLRVAALAARLGDPDLRGGDRRDRTPRAQAAHRGVLQQVPALPARDAHAARLLVDRLDQVADARASSPTA